MRAVNSPSSDWFVYSLHFTWFGAHRRDGNTSERFPLPSSSACRAPPPPRPAPHTPVRSGLPSARRGVWAVFDAGAAPCCAATADASTISTTAANTHWSRAFISTSDFKLTLNFELRTSNFELRTLNFEL